MHRATIVRHLQHFVLSLTLFAALICSMLPNIVSAAPSMPQVTASVSPYYQVVDADHTRDGGVFYRRSPHWNDTSRTVGVGGYYGESVRLECWATGDPVGPFGNRTWWYVTNVTRPTAGSGYLPDHYLSTPLGNPASLGAPECGSAPAPVLLPTPQSVYISGTSDAHGGTGHQVASVDYSFDTAVQAYPNCSLKSAVTVPAGTNTVAGWSKGRLGVLAFLKQATPTQYAAVHQIVLVDPGNSSDFTLCDRRLNANALLAAYVQANSQNHVLVLTGQRSEEKQVLGFPIHKFGFSTFKGLKNSYLADIQKLPPAMRARVLVCDYDSADHAKIMQEAWGVVKYPPSGCPVLTNEAAPVAWNP